VRITLAPVAVLVFLWGFGPASVAADGWERLEGDAITRALSARVLGYPDGTLQDFLADGRTLHGETDGRWEVRGDRYCSVWPPSDRWSCYAVDRNGLDIRFTADDGTVTVGRYVDLH
jgi:hypothetical protein